MKRKAIKNFPKNPIMVETPVEPLPGCDCNFCRLTKFSEEMGDDTVSYAYFVAEANMLELLIKTLEEAGWKATGLADFKNKRNLSHFKTELDDTKCLICDILKRKSTKIILKDSSGKEVK